MILKENEVYSIIKEAILKKYPKADVSSVYIRKPKKLPHVCVIQTDSYEPHGFTDSSMKENIVQLAFQIDVYSDNETRKKTECVQIMQIVDEELRSRNFRRIAMSPIPNMEDSTIYRLTARYSVVASKSEFFGT